MVMTHGLVALLIVLIVIVGSILTHRCEEFMIGVLWSARQFYLKVHF